MGRIKQKAKITSNATNFKKTEFCNNKNLNLKDCNKTIYNTIEEYLTKY